MRQLLVLLHLAAAIFWMGGMAFMVLALRPVLHEQLAPPQRLPLATAVLRRFFVVVIASIAVLLATGAWLLAQVPASQAPPGWHAMATLGIVMMLIFAYIWFWPYRRLRAAVAQGDWPEGGKQMGRVTLLAKINLGIGWVAIAAVVLWR